MNNLAITGADKEEVQKLKAALFEEFNIKDLGEVQIILGIWVQQFGNILTLDQSRYAAEIINKHYYQALDIFTTLININAVNILHKTPGEPLTTIEIKVYLKVLEKLIFLYNTQINITFAVHRCSQYSAKPGKNY